jgi:basic membrane protein A
MTSWYTAGTEVVFSCGGGIYSSCLTAATNANTATGTADAKMIGVDVDQSNESPLDHHFGFQEDGAAGQSVSCRCLCRFERWFADLWHHGCGQVVYKGVQDGDVDAGTNAVGLPTDEGSWRLTKWSVADYKAFFKKVKDGTPKIPEVDGSSSRSDRCHDWLDQSQSHLRDEVVRFERGLGAVNAPSPSLKK